MSTAADAGMVPVRNFRRILGMRVDQIEFAEAACTILDWASCATGNATTG